MKGLDSKTMGERIPFNDTPAVITSPFHDVRAMRCGQHMPFLGLGFVLMVLV